MEQLSEVKHDGAPSDSTVAVAATDGLGAHDFDFSAASFENIFIGISGLIGAGKTTLATALAKELNVEVFYEPVSDNEYLA